MATQRQNNNKNPRIGTRMRGNLTDAYTKRGHAHSNLNYAYSPKAEADVILPTNLHYGHFLLCEGTAEISNIDYDPPHSLSPENNEKPDAIITLETGEVQGVFIRSEEIPQHQIATECQKYIIRSEKEIYSNMTLIRNWNRIIPYIAQVRDIPLQNYYIPLTAKIKLDGIISLESILFKIPEDELAFTIAALFKAVQKGILYSDVDIRPFSKKTLFWMRYQNGLHI